MSIIGRMNCRVDSNDLNLTTHLWVSKLWCLTSVSSKVVRYGKLWASKNDFGDHSTCKILTTRLWVSKLLASTPWSSKVWVRSYPLTISHQLNPHCSLLTIHMVAFPAILLLLSSAMSCHHYKGVLHFERRNRQSIVLRYRMMNTVSCILFEWFFSTLHDTMGILMHNIGNKVQHKFIQILSKVSRAIFWLVKPSTKLTWHLKHLAFWHQTTISYCHLSWPCLDIF